MNAIEIKINNDQLRALLRYFHSVEIDVNQDPFERKSKQSIGTEVFKNLRNKAESKADSKKEFKVKLKYYQAHTLYLFCQHLIWQFGGIGYETNAIEIIKNQIHRQL